ncbi:transcriptional regulatory [Fusarium acutatum]|uniref:Transcriptional regulatory n=1 Tax=Fusarium acutatum TaxID=78861 RepID=A0A8H4JP43_9HYPO|nr:transcriptional regulatory [Fusarium acutatum]
MRPIVPLYSEASSPKPPSRILPPKGKKAVRRWERTGKPKPICVRCAKGKFDCDGYSSDSTREASDSTDLSCGTESSAGDMSTSPGTPATTLNLTPSPVSGHSEPCTWHESTSSFSPVASTYNPVYTEHFNQNANLSNALFSYSELYSSIVLREILQDECIQSAVLALGSFFYSGFILSQNGVQIEIANHHRHQSLQLYNVALHVFRMRMQSSIGTTSRWMVLMTPLLVMYELLQGDFDAADKLLSSAIEALRSTGDISHISTSESSAGWADVGIRTAKDLGESDIHITA